MAKKKKKAKPAPRKAAKKPAKKPAKKASKPRKASGPGPAEIGAEVVAHVNSGKPDSEIWAKWFSPSLVSVEGDGQEFKGMKAVKAKCEWWMSENTVNGCSAEGPYAGANSFAIRYRMDVTQKSTGNRIQMEEVGHYTVKNGKVIREEFMYGSMKPVAGG